jgi:hypothetical protein
MRRLQIDRVLAPAARCSALVLFLLAAGTAGCDVGVDGGDDGGDADGGDDGVGGGEPSLPPPAIYKRGSIPPNFELPSLNDLNTFVIPTVDVLLDNGVLTQPAAPTANQFACGVGGFVPLSQKMFEVQSQVAEETGEQLDLVGEDEILAETMPFRANPTDVDCLDIDGIRKCIVPLGGSVSTPGNEVAIVVGQNVERIRVGIRPIRTACHPDGVCFVANQYSNYISVIDMVGERLLENAGEPVEIAVDYYTSDIQLAENDVGGNFDETFQMYAANEWLGSVARYELRVELGGLDAGVDNVIRTTPPASGPESTPDFTYSGVGTNPQRLKLSEQQREMYVANGRGGEIALINIADDSIISYSGVGAPAVDIIEIQNNAFVATTMPDRGLLAQDEQVPSFFEQPPTNTTGLNGSTVEAHQGQLFDRTKAYNFEDIHNSIVALPANINQNNVFQQTLFTDADSVEENFQADQKVIRATLTGDMQTDGNTLFVVGEGNDIIQQLDVNGAAAFPLSEIVGAEFPTGFTPKASFLDLVAGELVAVTWGGGLLETFALEDFAPLVQVDLGYAADNDNGVVDNAEYPCSDIEIGEWAYITTEYSNNGFKSCVSCHRDELLGDGHGYSNGVTAPTTYHKVIPSYNQTTTGNYFWTGTFTNDSYLSLAFAAQTRTNCELQVFALTEGPGVPPDQRVGDANLANRAGQGNIATCQFDVVDPATGLPQDFFEVILPEINAQKALADNFITATVQGLVNKQNANLNDPDRPLTRVEVSRLMDWWMISQVRLPPNPSYWLNQWEQDSADTRKLIADGEGVFQQAGCNKCHDPTNARAPFTDGRTHGRGAEWVNDFIDRYDNDDRVNFDIAQEMLKADSQDASSADIAEEINLHLRMDGFMPFAFDNEDVLLFEDPLSQVGNVVEETRRLLVLEINLNDPERGFVPGYPIDQAFINTPALYGVWWNPNYLHHAMAKTFREAVVGPGHAALRPDLFLMNGAHPDLGTEERGWAYNAANSLEAHGATANLSDAQLKALEYYVFSLNSPND